MTLLALTAVFLFASLVTVGVIWVLFAIWRLPAEEESVFPSTTRREFAREQGWLYPGGEIYAWPSPPLKQTWLGSITWPDFDDTFTGSAGWPPKPTVFYDQEREDD